MAVVEKSLVVSGTAQAPIVEVDKALESWRDSGFDLSTAVGEVIDNSIEAKAKCVRIRMDTVETKGLKKVDSIAFADDGTGIEPTILPSVLSLGFSTRYNQRSGLGRFGVGMKLAAISQARRVEIYTRPMGHDRWYHVFLDLDMIKDRSQKVFEAYFVDGCPAKYRELMEYPKGDPFKTGTLVVWSKVDRLVDGGRFGSAIQEERQELIKFIARAYRKFIDAGFRIEFDERWIDLHDPLFLMDNPRVFKHLDKDVKAEVLEDKEIPIDGHKVRIVVTLLPRELREKRGKGGRQYPDLDIPDQARRISILRNNREIYYDVIPRMFPSTDSPKPDRFIGIEVSFPAVLDEYFQVRHVKRGAEPVSKLREVIRQTIERPVQVARKRIQEQWDEAAKRDREVSAEHRKSMDAVREVDQTSPQGRAGAHRGPQEKEQVIGDVLSDVGIDEKKEPERAERVRKEIEEYPITLIDSSWAGKELLDIEHLNGKALVKVNHRHPFIREIYEPIKEAAGKDSSEVTAEDLVRLARKVEVAIDVLFMAYAKAENMHHDPEDAYSDLRSYWGQFTAAYVREVLKDM
ncbi:MAG: ATP-binding protein [Ignavibacteriales bacterium]